MALYITLASFTDQGIRNVKDTTKRADAFKELAKGAGVTVKDIYWTLGQYDIVTVAEAPDDAVMTALGLARQERQCANADASRVLAKRHEQHPGQGYVKAP